MVWSGRIVNPLFDTKPAQRRLRQPNPYWRKHLNLIGGFSPTKLAIYLRLVIVLLTSSTKIEPRVFAARLHPSNGTLLLSLFSFVIFPLLFLKANTQGLKWQEIPGKSPKGSPLFRHRHLLGVRVGLWSAGTQVSFESQFIVDNTE